MDDVENCPVCGNKLRNNHSKNKFLFPINKTSDYVERLCSHGHAHIVSFWVDKKTKKVDFLRMSVNSISSQFIEIDFVNQKCRIQMKSPNKEPHYINVDRLLPLDFPNLEKLKEKISLFVLFS